MSAGDEPRDPWGVAGRRGDRRAGLGSARHRIVRSRSRSASGSVPSFRNQGRRRLAELPPRRESTQAQLPKPPRGSVQAALLARAESAQRRIRTLAETPGDDWLTAQIGNVDDEVGVVVEDRLADLAGRVTVADNSLQSARPDALAAGIRRGPGRGGRRERSGAAGRASAHRRCAGVADGSRQSAGPIARHPLARMQTAVVGLEGLSARMGELVALGSDPVAHDRSSEVLQVVTSDLDTVRDGLTEAEALSREL